MTDNKDAVLSVRGLKVDFTTPDGAWLEVRWLCDRNGHVEYVYEDTRGLNRPAARRG